MGHECCTCDDSYTRDMKHRVVGEQYDAARSASRPSVLFRPNISKDGDAWSVLLGSNIQEGVCGFGDSPEEAMADFDKAWTKQIHPSASPEGEGGETCDAVRHGIGYPVCPACVGPEPRGESPTPEGEGAR